MRSEQILLAVAIAREKSVTKAAESLFISQPTASNLLKSLEKELRYALFRRTRYGIVLTDEGAMFIEHAAAIERSLQSISRIGQHPPRIDFKVLSIKWVFPELAFEMLREQAFAGGESVDFSFQTINNAEDGTRMVENGLADVAVVPCAKAIYSSVAQRADKQGLETAMICERSLDLTCHIVMVYCECHSVHKADFLTDVAPD